MKLISRTKTRKIFVKNIQIGNQNNIIIQSMTNIKTSKVEEVLEQINKLYKEGCELVRVSILDNDDALSLKEITKKSPIPIIADIHFNPDLAILSIKNGAAKIRLNPGNISDKYKIKQICDLANEYKIPIRIGVNSGSLPSDLIKKYGISEKSMILTITRYIKLLNSYKFKNIILSLKSPEPQLMINSYLKAAKKFKYPLHLGVTEAGMDEDGIIKTLIGLSPLLYKNIGDTIRVSLSNDPVTEVYVAKKILNILGLRNNMVDIISCPTCGRLEYDMFSVVKEIKQYTKYINKKITISILGCVVNGIGEGMQADIGLAGSKNKCILFEKGNIIKQINKEDTIIELKKLIDKYK